MFLFILLHYFRNFSNLKEIGFYVSIVTTTIAIKIRHRWRILSFGKEVCFWGFKRCFATVSK